MDFYLIAHIVVAYLAARLFMSICDSIWTAEIFNKDSYLSFEDRIEEKKKEKE